MSPMSGSTWCSFPGWRAGKPGRRVTGFRGRSSAVPGWWQAGGFGPAPSLCSPPGKQGLVGAGQAEQLHGPASERLIQPALGRALQDAGDLGEQIRAPDRELGQLGDRGGLLIRGQITPPGVTPGGARDLGDEDAVSIGSASILAHLARIEHLYDKGKVHSVSIRCDPVPVALKHMRRQALAGCSLASICFTACVTMARCAPDRPREIRQAAHGSSWLTGASSPRRTQTSCGRSR